MAKSTQRLQMEELQNYKLVYMIGAGGVSMSSLALILREKGVAVRGYDRSRSGVTDRLEQAGVEMYYEDDPKAFEGVELVCFTAAVNEEHPQMILAKNSGAKIVSRAEMLGCLATSYPYSVAVAGTHGKSTTSGMLSHIFMHTPGCDPTVVVGAKITEIDSAYRIGKDGNFIFEACEYKDSFLSFYPKVAVVLNIQLDHTDYFHSLEHMRGSFEQFLSNTAEDGFCVLNLDCENCRIAMKSCNRKVVTYSVEGNEAADYYAKNIDLSDGFGKFDVYCRGEFLLHASLKVPGIHNVSNALAAVAASLPAGLSPAEIAEGLAGYCGVNRRFEFLCENKGARYFDDYAHHPDEIKVTLAAAKAVTSGRVICVFQPHNYSRLHDLFEDFKGCFGDADLLVLTKLYAAREAAGDEVSSALLAEQTGAVYIDDLQEIPAYLDSICREGDTVLIMGAGDIGKLAEKLKKSEKIS